MSRGRAVLTPFSWIVAAAALMMAVPAWSQAVAREMPDSARKVSKVDAINIKQSVTTTAGYLKIGDIKGESTDDKHKEEIEILSWSWGASQATARSRPASGPGTLTITKAVDKSSPKLMEASTRGRKIEQMTLTLPPRPGERARTVTLEGVVVSSVERSTSESMPTETISFNYEKIK
jgi:type VI secretion system secreted protein Hcp